eukprot:6483808-Amphidinium_carterae.1
MSACSTVFSETVLTALHRRCGYDLLLVSLVACQHIFVASFDNDPAGDSKPDITLAEHVLACRKSKKFLEPQIGGKVQQGPQLAENALTPMGCY